MEVADRIRGAFPVAAGPMDLTLEQIEKVDGGWVGVVRIVVWDADRAALRDVKEQQVRMLREADAADVRLEAALTGWADALAEAGRAVPDPDPWTSLMPCDLWGLPELLRLKRPRTAEQFCGAMLRRPRLGRLIDGD